MSAPITHLSTYRARSLSRRAQAAAALLTVADAFREQVARCEAAALLEGPKQVEAVSVAAAVAFQGSLDLDALVDELLAAAPREPLGAKEGA